MDPERPQWSGASVSRAIWQSRALIAAVTILAGLAGFGVSQLQSKSYEAQVSIILSDPRNAGVFRDTNQVVVDPRRYVLNQAERIESSTVLQRAVELENERLTLQQAQQRVNASAAVNLDLITIRAADPTAAGAASLANSVGLAYQQIIREDVQASADEALGELERARTALQTRIDELEEALREDASDAAARAERDAAVAQLATLRTRAEQIAVDAALYGSGVEVFEEAIVPAAPASPKPLRNAVIAAALGFLAAAALAWWRSEFRQRAVARHDPARVLRAPLLGEIPTYDSLRVKNGAVAVAATGSEEAEAFQFVYGSLAFALEGSKSIVVVTSASQGDGKTVTAINLAAAAVRSGRSVLLIDGDERLRGLTDSAEMSSSPGLTDLVTADALLEESKREIPVNNGDSVAFIPGGTKLRDPAGFFATSGFRQLMSDVRNEADLVLIDTPPILAVADASAMAAQADGIVLVISRGVSLARLEEVRHRLDFVGTPLLGYIFNRAGRDAGRHTYVSRYRNKTSPVLGGDGRRRSGRSSGAAEQAPAVERHG